MPAGNQQAAAANGAGNFGVVARVAQKHCVRRVVALARKVVFRQLHLRHGVDVAQPQNIIEHAVQLRKLDNLRAQLIHLTGGDNRLMEACVVEAMNRLRRRLVQLRQIEVRDVAFVPFLRHKREILVRHTDVSIVILDRKAENPPIFLFACQAIAVARENFIVDFDHQRHVAEQRAVPVPQNRHCLLTSENLG